MTVTLHQPIETVAHAGRDASADAEARLRHLISGYRATFLLRAAAELGLADLLANGPRGRDELAAAADVDVDALRRVLFALVQLGVVEKRADGRFALTSLGAPLRSDHPSRLNAFARFQAHDMIQRPWANLPHTVRTGETAFDAVFGMGPFDYFAAHRDEAALFTAGMAARTAASLAPIVHGYDWCSCTTIVDVGGGDGALLANILAATPNSEGIVFDQARVAAAARTRLAEEGLETRCRFVGGDFFAAVPAGADAYLLKHVLHDWSDLQVLDILRVVRIAMPAHGRVLVIEPVVPEDDAPALETAMMDVAMLVFTGGRERTAAEFAALYAGAGLRVTRVVPTTSMFSIVEGVPET
jgi:hypothetical protein